MKTMTTATAIALASLSACSPGEDWNAHRSDMERFEYVGPRTPEAVCQYVEDAADAVDDVMENVEGIEEAHYMPKTGRLAVRLTWPNKLGNFEVGDVFNYFHDRRLHIVAVTELRKLGNETTTTGRRYGGRDRVEKLSDIPTPEDACDVEFTVSESESDAQAQ